MSDPRFRSAPAQLRPGDEIGVMSIDVTHEAILVFGVAVLFLPLSSLYNV